MEPVRQPSLRSVGVSVSLVSAYVSLWSLCVSGISTTIAGISTYHVCVTSVNIHKMLYVHVCHCGQTIMHHWCHYSYIYMSVVSICVYGVSMCHWGNILCIKGISISLHRFQEGRNAVHLVCERGDNNSLQFLIHTGAEELVNVQDKVCGCGCVGVGVWVGVGWVWVGGWVGVSV